MIADVITLRAKIKSESLVTKKDIPARTLDALAAYEGALASCRYENDKRRREEEGRTK